VIKWIRLSLGREKWTIVRHYKWGDAATRARYQRTDLTLYAMVQNLGVYFDRRGAGGRQILFSATDICVSAKLLFVWANSHSHTAWIRERDLFSLKCCMGISGCLCPVQNVPPSHR